MKNLEMTLTTKLLLTITVLVLVTISFLVILNKISTLNALIIFGCFWGVQFIMLLIISIREIIEAFKKKKCFKNEHS